MDWYENNTTTMTEIKTITPTKSFINNNNVCFYSTSRLVTWPCMNILSERLKNLTIEGFKLLTSPKSTQ